MPAVRKLENSLLKLYAVTCVSTKQAEKLKEFFERIASDVHGQQEWKDWFALPWLKDHQDNPAFSLYFTRQWQDTLMLSLHNFLALVFTLLNAMMLKVYHRLGQVVVPLVPTLHRPACRRSQRRPAGWTCHRVLP